MSSKSKKHTIYLDNAASTPVDPRVLKEMAEAVNLYGNPSSFNNVGREAKKKLESSRGVIARFLGAQKEEIIFTSSGSEANNMAIQGIVKTKIGETKPHIITTQIEHPSVLEPIKQLSGRGFDITYLPVNDEGLISTTDLQKALRPETVLVSVMYANNEIGTIQPIKKIAKVINDFKSNGKIFFHVDACQATEWLDMNVNNLNVDLMTFNGSKIYGPRGIGVLYKKRSVSLSSLVFGGDQEHGLRAGTENLPAIAGLAKAVSLINKKETVRLTKLRNYFFSQIKKNMEVKINGPEGDGGLPNNINVSISGLSSENLLLELDKHGISASSGSACTSHSVEPSHVLKAIGVEEKYLDGALRFSLGRQTTKKDIDYVLEVLPKIEKELKKRYK